MLRIYCCAGQGLGRPGWASSGRDVVSLQSGPLKLTTQRAGRDGSFSGVMGVHLGRGHVKHDLLSFQMAEALAPRHATQPLFPGVMQLRKPIHRLEVGLGGPCSTRTPGGRARIMAARNPIVLVGSLALGWCI